MRPQAAVSVQIVGTIVTNMGLCCDPGKRIKLKRGGVWVRSIHKRLPCQQILALGGEGKWVKGGCPFDSKTDENPVYTQFDGTLRIYSEMRPIPDILAGNQLGPRLSTQIQERNGRALLF
jgi:hypothetical protein